MDLCGATDTRNNNERYKMLISGMEDSFHCITKIRKNRKAGDHGSGGLAIVVRKGRGIPKLAKAKGSDEILWIEMEGMGQKIFVAVVYLVPNKSSRYKYNGDTRRELEEDILRFKKDGLVVVLGDLNSRIADSQPSDGVVKNNTRENKDKKLNDNGKAWIRLTRNTDMVTLTGLFGVADYTCFNEQGNSVPDHICIDRRNKDLVMDFQSDREVMGRISTDHSMIIARVRLPDWKVEEKQRTMEINQRKKSEGKKKTRLNRIKKKEVWDKYKESCESNPEIPKTVLRLVERIQYQNLEQQDHSTEESWTDVKDLVRTLELCASQFAEKEGDIHFVHLNQSLQSNSEIAIMIEEKTKAWRDLRRKRDDVDEKLLRRIFNNKKNVLNKARRRIREKLKREKIKEIESLKPNYPGEFWKQLKAVAGRKKKKSTGQTGIDDQGNEVRGDDIKAIWKRSFEKLGKRDDEEDKFDREAKKRVTEEVEEITNSNTERGKGELNEPIRFEEVRSAIAKLKNGKAAGIDEMVNEVIKHGGEPVHIVIWQLINACFESEDIPQEWMKGVIFPIYKAGDGRNPDNYRGITLLCITNKIYTTVLNARLSRWCEANGIIAEEQGGFRPGRGCVDQLFVLINILRNRIGKWTHCCFIDIRKAFDRVWRNGLWKRLWDEGIRGKMWRVCKRLYKNTKSCVQVGPERTEFFDVEAGVRQGCGLSSILFSIFINTLAKEITQSSIGIIVENEKIAILLYADDIVLITDSAVNLKIGLRIATDWGKKWRCSFNQKKSNVIVFGQRRIQVNDWTLGGKRIKQVDTYKYLGLNMKGNLKWKDMKERLTKKTRRIMTIVWAMGVQAGHLSVKAADIVWKALVRPIAEYGAEIWGEDKWEQMEKIQRDMGKRILGLDQSTCNQVVLGEMGWWKMKARRDMLRLRYWWKLIRMSRKRLPRKIYDWEMRGDSKKIWTTYTRKLLKEIGLEDYWIRQKIDLKQNEWNSLVEEKIQTNEQRTWRKEMSERPKLRTYRKFKEELVFEEYLENEDIQGRKLMAKLRSGTNCLRIETGRREGLTSADRKCWFGCDSTEDEAHFLLDCWLYSNIREDMIAEVGKEEFKQRGLAMMMGKGNSAETIAAIKFIKRAIAKRSRMLELRGR